MRESRSKAKEWEGAQSSDWRSVIMGAVQYYYFHLHLTLEVSKLPEGRDAIFSRSPTLCWA